MAAQAETPQLKRAQDTYSPLNGTNSSPSSSSVLTPGSVSPRRAKRRSPAPVLARWQFEVDDSAHSSHSFSSPGGSIKASTPTRTSGDTPSKLTLPAMHAAKESAAATPCQLADDIQNLSISERPAEMATVEVPITTPKTGVDGENPDQAPSTASASTQPTIPTLDIPSAFSRAFDDITAIRSSIFQLEEKRHSGSPLADGEMEMAVIQLDSLLERISKEVQQLEGAISHPIHAQGESENPASTLSDTGNLDNDALMEHRITFDSLAEDWMSIQSEVETLKKELSDTKYLEHFQTFSKQVTEIMDSLERAVSECHDFVLTFRKGLSDPSMQESGDDLEDEETQKQEKVQRFEAVRRSFKTKLSYYLPPCEQTFSSFERSLKERGTSHGMVLRQLGELKSRWRGLKERSSKVDRELKKIEKILSEPDEVAEPGLSPTAIINSGVGHSQSSNRETGRTPLLPVKSARRLQRSASSNPTSPEISMSAPVPASPLPADSSMPSTPLKPPRSSRRVSSVGPPSSSERFPGIPPASGGLIKSPPTSGLLLAPPTNTRIPSASPRSPLGTPSQRISLSLDPPKDGSPASAKRISGIGLPGSRASQAPSTYRALSGNLGTPADRGISLRSRTPQPPLPSQRARSEALSRGTPTSLTGGDDETMETLMSRPGSRMSAQQSDGTPASNRMAARRISHIPTLTPRPSSVMSTSRPTGGTSAPMTPSASIPGRSGGTSRLAMQTPEPVIAARVRGLSVYSKPSTGSPSTSSLPSGSAGPLGTPRRKVLGGSNKRPPVSRSSIPPSPALHLNGRTTPLSASALAKVPHAAPITRMPGDDKALSVARPPSVASSSVANFRASRAQAAVGAGGSVHLGTPTSRRSGRDGATTPTFSEGGYSSFSHGTTGFGIGFSGGGGRTSRAGSVAATSRFPYRPNPNDALDVAISRITNREGIYLTREDPPLPRGMKSDTGPGKEVRARYRFGGQNTIMTCKLLELHKPARANAVVTRQMEEEGFDERGVQRKVLVKVPSKGFLDLKVWLGSTFAQLDEENEGDGVGDMSMISFGPDESLGETF